MDTEENLAVELNIGTLATVILMVVTSCSAINLISICFWRRSVSRQPMHCSSCHHLVAVQGVRFPPQDLRSVQNCLSASQHIPRIQVIPPAASGHPGLNAHHSTPHLTVPPGGQIVDCGDSATFQRLGMLNQPSRLSVQARALEAPDSGDDSPPEPPTEDTDVEILSPVRQDYDVHLTPIGGKSGVMNKMSQVRVLHQLPHQTPGTRTPANAARRQAASIEKGVRSVTALMPTHYYEARSDGVDLPLLETSTLTRTVVTTGDLDELCETSLIESQITPASVESSSHTLTNKDIEKLVTENDDDVFLEEKKKMDKKEIHKEDKKPATYSYQKPLNKGSLLGHLTKQANNPISKEMKNTTDSKHSSHGLTMK